MTFQLLQRLRRLVAGFWFFPTSMALWSVGFAAVMLALDAGLDLSSHDLSYLPLVSTAADARVMLGTIAGASISVAGVVFSITIVVLNMASAQFGPRLLRNFMEKRGTQIVLGAFLGTFIYCIIVLGFVREGGGDIYLPKLATAGGMMLGINSFFMLIYFINLVSVSIQASRVIDDVAERMQVIMRRTFPERDENAPPESESTPDEEDENLDQRLAEQGRAVFATRSGYVQAIDLDALLKLATDENLQLRLDIRPGHFIIAGEQLASVLPANEQRDELEKDIQRAVILGPERESTQDPEFAIHQLVEIALRALSPGINDPYTAINCVDRLGAMLAEMAGRRLPSRYLRDAGGRRRVVTNPFTYAGMVDAAFDQLRQHSDGNAAVTFRLLEIIARLGAREAPQPFHKALAFQLDAIGTASRDDFHNATDNEGYRKRLEAARESLQQSPAAD